MDDRATTLVGVGADSSMTGARLTEASDVTKRPTP
jgi:hypothetical protein